MQAKTVFILGAGASRAAGGPLMWDFIEKAGQIIEAGQAGWAAQSFKCVFEARRKLQAAYAKSHLDIDNIEDLFATYEMAKLIGQLDDMTVADIEKLPAQLRFMIMRTLEKSIQFPLYDEDEIVGCPTPFDAFVELLIQMETSRKLSPVTIISFNYDLALDYAIATREIEIDYGLKFHAGKEQVIRLLKPHGSLNWTTDKISGEIEAVPVRALPRESYRRRLGVYNPRRISIDTMELLHGPDEWGETLRPEPLIVPPTWSKAEYQETLKPIWRQACKALSTAQNVFVIGYSLPPSDQFFRSFFALSTLSDSIIDRFWLFDPADIAARWQSLCGPAIFHRDKFRHEMAMFPNAIAFLAKAFDLDEYLIQVFLNRSSSYGQL
jgi:hypothetical protein